MTAENRLLAKFTDAARVVGAFSLGIRRSHAIGPPSAGGCPVYLEIPRYLFQHNRQRLTVIVSRQNLRIFSIFQIRKPITSQAETFGRRLLADRRTGGDNSNAVNKGNSRMKRIIFAALAATLLAGSTGCGVLDVLLVRPGCGPFGVGPIGQEPQYFEEGPATEESGCCDSGDGESCCRPFPLMRMLSALNPCNWGCGRACGEDQSCGDGGCGPFGGRGLFGCGPLFWGWGCGDRYYGDFWGSRCETCDQHGGWTGPTDTYYPHQSASPHAHNTESELPPVAPIENDVKPMPTDDPAPDAELSPDAVEGSQTRNSTPRIYRQAKSKNRSTWKARRSY